jgi:hypothetical protein
VSVSSSGIIYRASWRPSNNKVALDEVGSVIFDSHDSAIPGREFRGIILRHPCNDYNAMTAMTWQ